MKYYTAEEAAKKLKVSTSHVYELVKRGELKKKEGLGRTIRIPSSELKNVKVERDYFLYDEDKVQVIETYLGRVRKLKEKDEYVISDLVKVLGLKDSYSIVRRLDESTYKKIEVKEAQDLGIFVNQYGLLLINYKGIVEYSKKSRSKNSIDFNRLLNELKCSEYEQINFTGVKKDTNKLVNMFEGHKVEIIIENGQPLFELYSTGMALGYITKNSKGAEYPHRVRIDKIVDNIDILMCVRGVHSYMTESQLYDFMLEARTEKCKSFRKWVTNEVLPTIRKTGGYVDNSEKFVDNYFSNLSKNTKETILSELENKNKALMAERVKIDKELLDNTEVIEKIQETL